ncbi:hypothetical protein DCAR_0521953 [Daucus carota subsp. sativus]|uniref:Uncharacterized protein n=2 Tax=Daucus carota subsp. sativus TaxID=79200 RepID=A0AAF0X8V0_DAUCS|nr:PREDICTED: uncharacterized protein LOC108221793 [Daucus carota subsp. sativus]WOH02564.1 hypothetical protein DCAR_0521953 [Daucus carota subsp. sativus]
MAVVYAEQEQAITQSAFTSQPPRFSIRFMSKRTTWVILFIFVSVMLLSSSWNLLNSVSFWYDSSVSTPSDSPLWPAIYASMALGLILGLVALLAALAVLVPETLMVWITVLVLLNFCRMPGKTLVLEGKKLTGEMACVVLKVLIREGKFFVAVCAVLAFGLLCSC